MALRIGDGSPNTRTRGQKAEQVAVDYLSGLGYRIVERNFSCKLGEIDIVARQGGDLVFVEVRSRHSVTARDPVHTVDRRKQAKLIRAASFYLMTKHPEPIPARFDVVLVTLGEPPTVEVIPNAIDAP